MRMTETIDNPQTDSIPLAQLRRGEFARITCCEAGGCCAQLIESLGLDRDALVSICRHGDPCIIRVHDRCGGSCRIGLRREISHRIMVRPADV